MTEKRSAADIQAEIEQVRADLANTVDQLRQELDPGKIAANAVAQVKQTTSDAATALRGGGLPEDDSRATKAKVALVAAGATAGLVLLKLVRRRH